MERHRLTVSVTVPKIWHNTEPMTKLCTFFSKTTQCRKCAAVEPISKILAFKPKPNYALDQSEKLIKKVNQKIFE